MADYPAFQLDPWYDELKDYLESTYLSSPSDPPADAQYPRYDEATDKLVWTNPVGQSEIASAVNVGGATTAISSTGGQGTEVTVLFTSISVGDSNGRPVTLEYEGHFLQTALGNGSVFLSLYETTSGTTLLGYSVAVLPNQTSTARRQLALPVRHMPIGVVTTARTFLLKASIYAETEAADPAGAILNSAAAPTILRALAG